MKLDITEYSFNCPSNRNLIAAVLSDIHGERFDYILDEVKKRNVDLILIPGDIIHRHNADPGNGKTFLTECAKIAPTFMSLGNHETVAHENVRIAAKEAGIELLEDRYVEFEGLYIGGLTSGYLFEKGKLNQGHFKKTPAPKLDFLNEFSSLDGYKILLSHHPEYYPEYEKDKNIDVIFSGHAHGGQWRIFGQPIFAPGQKFFPKYAQGITDNRLVVSRGLANNGPAPRFGNNRELIFVEFNKM